MTKINPQTLLTTAREVLNQEETKNIVTDNGFVVQHSRNRKGCTFVGMRNRTGAENEYIVGKM